MQLILLNCLNCWFNELLKYISNKNVSFHFSSYSSHKKGFEKINPVIPVIKKEGGVDLMKKEYEENIFLDEPVNGERSNIFDEDTEREKEERERIEKAKRKRPENIFDK